MRTLIVEDNAVFRRSFKGMLQAMFPTMTIEEAVDGSEALEKMKSFAPEVVFMDIRLPGMNGLKVTRMMRERNCPAIIIILTSHELPEYREAAFACGADHFLTKGTVSMKEIVTLIESIDQGDHDGKMNFTCSYGHSSQTSAHGITPGI